MSRPSSRVTQNRINPKACWRTLVAITLLRECFFSFYLLLISLLLIFKHLQRSVISKKWLQRHPLNFIWDVIFIFIFIFFYTTGSEKVLVKIQELHPKKKALLIKAEKLNCVYVYQYQRSHLSDHSPTCSYKKQGYDPPWCRINTLSCPSWVSTQTF